MMKLTYSTLAAPGWTLAQIVDHAVTAGISGIDFRGIGPELDITRLAAFNEDLSGTLKLLHDNHLHLPCLNTSITLVTPSATRWESMIEEARRYAQLANQTGTPFLRIFGGGIPVDLTRDHARQIAIDHLRELVDICTPCNCKPLLETHDSWILHPHVLQLLENFHPAEAGVLWDLEHPWRQGESPSETTANLNSRIEHIHIKDTIRRNDKSIPLLLGDGEVPLPQCLTALRSINYNGWICLETEKRWHPEGPEPEQSVPQFANYMRAHTA